MSFVHHLLLCVIYMCYCIVCKKKYIFELNITKNSAKFCSDKTLFNVHGNFNIF